MASPLLVLGLGLGFLLLMASPSDSQSTCSSQSFSKNRLYSLCSDLPQLSSSLHWNYDASKSTLSVAFSAAPAKSGGWIAWAINPTGTGMVGAQTLLAFRQADGSMAAKTYNISGYGSVHESKIAFEVSDLAAEASGGVMVIFATVKLPAGMSKVNQVWQVGPAVTGSGPAKHDFNPGNLQAKGTLDLLKGQTSSGGVDSRLRRANTHGVLNAVSWGILLPIGAIVARYLRTFKSADPAWFYLHASCQLIGYGVGVAGWATGLSLGNESKGVVQTTHRSVGIALFTLATLQIFALFLRPKKDHKYRIYWNAYHHAIGYVVIILGIFNVFKGLSILRPDNKWKTAYIFVISVLGVIALFLEVVTWIIVLRRRKDSDSSTKLYDNAGNGHARRPV